MATVLMQEKLPRGAVPSQTLLFVKDSSESRQDLLYGTEGTIEIWPS